jgi:hypothetical protein
MFFAEVRKMAQTLVKIRDVPADAFYGERNTAALDASAEQLRRGKTAAFSIRELEEMETMTPDEARTFAERAKKLQGAAY